MIMLKLSLHYLNQMENATIEQMRNGEAIGYIIINNIRIGLIKHQNDYFKLDLNIGKDDYSKQWWTTFLNIKDRCLKRHLYYDI